LDWHITLRGTSILNITNQTIELLDGRFSANESSTINFGAVSTYLGQTVYSGGCQLLISRNNDEGGSASDSLLSYTTGSDRSSTASKINIYNSVVSIRAGSNRSNLFVSAIYNSLLYVDSTDNGSLGSFCFLQGNGVLAGTKFTRLSIELAGSNIQVSGFETVLPKYAFLNYTGVRQSFSGVSSLTSLTMILCADNSRSICGLLCFPDKGAHQSVGSPVQQSRQLASRGSESSTSGSPVQMLYCLCWAHKYSSVTVADGNFNCSLVWQEQTNG
jgi:hypothetical protein